MTAIAACAAAVIVLLVAARFRPRPPARTAAPTLERRGPSGGHGKRSRSLGRGAMVAVVVVFAAVTIGPFAASALVIAAVLRPRIRAIRATKRRAAAITVAYPDLVDLLVLTITSGCSPTQAVTALVPVAPEPTRAALVRLERRIATGDRFADAIGVLQDPPPIGLGGIAQPLTDALALADRYGTPLAPVLDRLAADARGQRQRNAEAAARQLPIRLAFPLVGCTLPSFVLLTVVPLMAGTFSSLRGLTP